LNMRIALMLFLVLFASTIATVTMVFNSPTLDVFGKARNALYDITYKIQPLGDPIGDPNFPN